MTIPDGLPELGDMIKQISENPQAREMLASLLGGDAEEEPGNIGSASVAEEAVPAWSPSPTPHMSQAHRGGFGRHRPLLTALRPYLGERRCATLSRMERAIELYELIEQMKHTKGNG